LSPSSSPCLALERFQAAWRRRWTGSSRRLGWTPRQIDTLVLFARLTNLDDAPPGGALILRGSFDEELLFEAMEKVADGALEETEYKEHRIYSDGDQDLAFDVLEKGTLVLGSPEGVRAVIDVRVGCGSLSGSAGGYPRGAGGRAV